MRKPDSDCPEVAGPQCGLDLRRPRRGRRPQTSRSGTWALRLPLAALWMLRAACGRAFRANRRHPNDQHEPLAGPPRPRFRTPPRGGASTRQSGKARWMRERCDYAASLIKVQFGLLAVGLPLVVLECEGIGCSVGAAAGFMR